MAFKYNIGEKVYCVFINDPFENKYVIECVVGEIVGRSQSLSKIKAKGIPGMSVGNISTDYYVRKSDGNDFEISEEFVHTDKIQAQRSATDLAFQIFRQYEV